MSTSAKFISDILDQTLSIEGSDAQTSASTALPPASSTSRLLLEQINKRKESQSDFIKVAPKAPVHIDPLLVQIGESKPGQPTYWKGMGLKPASSSSAGGSASSSLSSSAGAGSAAATSSNREPSALVLNNPQLPAGHKQKQQKKNKGESYADRLNQRVSSNQHRKQRLNQYSKIY